MGIWNTNNSHAEYFPQKPFESLTKSFQDSLINSGVRENNQALFKGPVCSDNYLKFIVEELKPYIDNNYATHQGASNTFISGSSMGGLVSMYALCEYPDVFSGAGCLSTHWIGTFETENNPIPAAFAKYLAKKLPNPSTHKIYFDYGTETLDALYEPYQLMIDSIVSEHGYDRSNWKTMKFEGANHSENAWKDRLHIPLSFLLNDVKDTSITKPN